MDNAVVKNIIEASLLAASKPLSVDNLWSLFGDGEKPEKSEIRQALEGLQEEYAERGVQLAQVASGYRMQVNTRYTEWVSRLWSERPPKYSRALLETLSIIAYRQPATRGDVEQIRGVAVSTNIIRTLEERGWIKEVGHRDVPGRPALFGTTKEFLDYFGLKRLQDLPTLAEIRDLDNINVELDLEPQQNSNKDPQQDNLLANEAIATSDDSEDDLDRAALNPEPLEEA